MRMRLQGASVTDKLRSAVGYGQGDSLVTDKVGAILMMPLNHKS